MSDPIPAAVTAADGAWPAWAQAARRKEDPSPARGRAESEDAVDEGGKAVDGNHVTIRLVSISALVAIAAFTVGNWVGHLHSRISKIEDAIVLLSTEVRSLKDWRSGPRAEDGR